MDAIYIPQLLKRAEQTEVIPVNEFIAGLETLTPVRGKVHVTHQGTYLEVSAQAETIVTLTCHRCLQQYNHRLKVDTSELVWLDESANEVDDGPLERETPLKIWSKRCHRRAIFKPIRGFMSNCAWRFPRQLCDQDCPGIAIASSDDAPTDRRWDALKNLKGQLPS